MTAAELFALYSPLWERVPETKPQCDDDDDVLTLEIFDRTDDFNRGGFAWWNYDIRYGQRPYLEEIIDTTSAAALCRCAVEDWIHKNATDAGIFEDAIRLWHAGDRYLETIGSVGPTLHHSLVEAAHTVADALGVAK